ncbi:MAG TPA: hypothetical protein VG964_01530, partial [Candidatus Saccharimonadales bacterium]|nr:hypothetical protein [Candidatus Saccharimonadales bacterium]
MPDDRKVFDIARPTATATARPVIPSGPPAADPMVNVKPAPAPARSIPLKVAVEEEEETASAAVPVPATAEPSETPSTAPVVDQAAEVSLAEEPKPEISNIPVSEAPDEPPAVQAATATEVSTGTITPALPGAPEASFASVPKFGELQSKIDAHPLFSGHKERRVKVRRVPRFFWPLVLLLILLAVAYLAIDAGLVRGASHLPFHVFKQETPVAATQPITQVSQQPSTTTPATTETPATTPDPYAGWKSYTMKYEKLSFKYPAAWTLKDTSGAKSDQISLTAANGFELNIQTGGIGHPSVDTSQPVIGAKVVTFAGQQGYIDYVSTKNDKLIEEISLSKSSTGPLDTFSSKTSGMNTGGGGNIVITASYKNDAAAKGLSLREAAADTNYTDAISL